MLRESFRRLGDLPAEGLPGEILAFPSPAWEYRNRLKLHAVPLGDQDLPPGGRNLPARTPAVGFKSPQENQVVPVGDCPVADPGIRALLVRGELRAPPGRERFYVYGRQGLVLQEGGEDRGRLRIRDREFLMEAGLFFQSNAAMLEVLVEDLRALATGADRSLPLADLYCGVGTFGAFLSPLFPWVDGLEENRAALALARQNIGPGRHNFYGLTDNEWVKMLEAEDPARSYGLIVADPPRRGLSPPMRRWLARGPAPLLAYVSCDAATLARDSGELLRGAWELEELVCYDFYPQTAHIESLALFRRRRGR
jgi:23S rRNA (uracil1939-C5)-methyltransferase